jgi:Holliday junction DNA helicase RuvB
VVTAAAAAEGLALFEVDERGLDKVDRAILAAVCRRFGGGPVGLSTLAICVGEATETVEDVYEPFLLQQGLLMRTPRGRVATPGAWAHLGLTAPAPAGSAADPGLFGP